MDVFKTLGIDKYVDDPKVAQSLEALLAQIGALALHEDSYTELIKLEVLLSALRVHGYRYGSHQFSQQQMKEFDFRKLSPKAVRIMNRLTRVLCQYQHKYQ